MTRLPKAFILATIIIDAIGIGLILPVMPDLIADVNGATIAQAAVWGGILTASYALMQFLFSPTLGNLSDRFGRRPVLLVSLAIMAVNYVIMALAQTIWLLLIGRIISGIAGATNATAMAVMSDITEPDKRAQNFGLISACYGVGFILGPLIGGLLGEVDPRAPFIAAAMLAGANFLFGLIVSPETLKPEDRRPFDLARANPVGGLKHISALSGARRLLSVMTLYQIANYVYPAIWAFFTIAAFGWDTRIVGLSLAAYGISMAVVQAGLIRIIIARIGEARAATYGMALNTVSLILFGVASQGWMIWFLIPLSAMGAIVAPAMQALLSQATPPDQQGELQGVLASIHALAMILSPLIMTQVFFWFTAEGASFTLPGAPFLVAAVLMAMGFALIVGRRAARPAAA